MPRRARSQLGFEIYASDRTKQGIASVHRGFSGLTQGVSKEAGIASQAIGGAIMGNATFAAAAAGAAMIGFAASATSAFIDVERRWAEVTTLMPQATKRATDEMLGDVRAFSRETGFAIQDSISASYQALSAGIETGQSHRVFGDRRAGGQGWGNRHHHQRGRYHFGFECLQPGSVSRH